jgi:hypothetical protein
MALVQSGGKIVHFLPSLSGQQINTVQKLLVFQRQPASIHQRLGAPLAIAFRDYVSCIESRAREALAWSRSPYVTLECITAAVGLRKRTNLTSPCMRDPLTTVSKIRLWNANICSRPLKCVPSNATKSASSQKGGEKSRSIVSVPGVDHPIMDGPDRLLIVGSVT